MTLHAIAGLLALDVLLLAAGCGMLWAARGWSSWLELLRLAGLAYLLGVAAVGTLLVLELIVAIRFGLVTVVLTALAVLCAGAGIGRLLGRRAPPLRRPHAPWAGSWWLAHGIGVAVAALYLEAQFRAARLAGLFEWDAMAFWIPKAKAIYYFGGLDHQFFATLPGPSYPPLIPALNAAGFEFMGGTLHLLSWSLLVGFVTAVAGVLAPRVRPLALWPALLLIVLTPVVIDNGTALLADLPLDYFVALAALMLVLWLRDGERWQLAVAATLLAAAVLTKREGQLLAACILVPAMIASLRRWRRSWPWLLLLGAIALAITRPWHHWFSSRGIATGVRAEAPEIGYFGIFHHLGRVWPSLELTLKVLFDGDHWLIAPPVFLLALALALRARERTLPVFAGAFFVLTTLACAWVILSFPSLPITDNPSLNPIVRLSGGLVLPLAALLPLLLDEAWSSHAPSWHPAPAVLEILNSRRLAVGLVVLVAVAYPVAALAGGLPRFASRSDCSPPATHDGSITLVLGTFRSGQPATAMLEQVKKLGYIQARVLADACGNVKVAVTGYPTLAGAENAVAEAHRAGLRPALEQG
jgi:hypothetical protein